MSDPVYLVNPIIKAPQRVEPVSFSALNVRERQDLEEWVLNHPEILGEPLLVITSEFDRFDRSNRRLDVLALDARGVLVVIELKLDVADSLADQQAIRYAAFCSTMTMAQAVELYSQHHGSSDEEAAAEVCAFLQTDELPELGNRPRIILAAGSMNDPELTSSVLWLRGFGLDITCVELTPYRLANSNEILVVPRVIIPLPEARDYIISVERKEVARVQESKEKGEYSQFWKMLAEEFNALGLPQKASDRTRDIYLQVRPTARLVHYEWIFRKRPKILSVALHFESSREQNLQWLAPVQAQAAAIQSGVDLALLVRRPKIRIAPPRFSAGYPGSCRTPR